MLLQPFMWFTGSKDSHWWDWEHFELEAIQKYKLLNAGYGLARRQYANSKFFGR